MANINIPVLIGIIFVFTLVGIGLLYLLLLATDKVVGSIRAYFGYREFLKDQKKERYKKEKVTKQVAKQVDLCELEKSKIIYNHNGFSWKDSRNKELNNENRLS